MFKKQQQQQHHNIMQHLLKVRSFSYSFSKFNNSGNSVVMNNLKKIVD